MTEPDNHPLKGKPGLARIKSALGYSLDGWRTAFRNEQALRQEVAIALALLPFALLLPLTLAERAVLIAAILLVLIVELLNSAIEAVVDRVSLERHELAKRAKDYGSAAVMLSILTGTMLWLAIAGPALLKVIAARL
jgi:diacylglycerol kinase (ATP)